jgi:hypothetical protein
VFVYDTSIPPGAGNATWWTAGAAATTALASSQLTASNLTWRFVGWELDGVHLRDSSNLPVNPIANIAMNSAHTAVAVYLVDGADNDGDGLPDWWEYTYFGGTGYGANADPDQDGQNNGSEWRAGTNPALAASVLQLFGTLNGAVPGGEFILRWPSVPGRTYRVLSSTNLGAAFSVIASNIPPAPPTNSHVIPLDGSKQTFYRVGVE